MSGGTAAVSVALAVAGTAMSMYSQYEQGKQQAKAATAQAEYNAQVAENEKAQQQQLAQNEIAKGIAERDRHMRNVSRQQGEMASMLAASGFEIDSGSNLSMLGESAEEAQYDANIITQNSHQAAWQHQVGVNAADNQLSLLSAQKSNAKTGTDWLGMGGTLLGGIASGMHQWNGYKATQGAGSAGGKFYDPALQKMVPSPVRH